MNIVSSTGEFSTECAFLAIMHRSLACVLRILHRTVRFRGAVQLHPGIKDVVEDEVFCGRSIEILGCLRLGSGDHVFHARFLGIVEPERLAGLSRRGSVHPEITNDLKALGSHSSESVREEGGRE